MKLLFDQNISFRVAVRLQPEFPGCGQVRQLGLEDRSDMEIWEYAKNNGYTIVTFDADFHDLVTLYGHPPKVVWLWIGNTTSENLIALLQTHKNIIQVFMTDRDYREVGCLEIRQD